MIYLTLDTNIWLNSLSQVYEGVYLTEALKYLSEKGYVKLLLPEIIKIEFERNRDSKRETLIREWKLFFEKANKLFDKKSINLSNSLEGITALADSQLELIDEVFNSHVELIQITDEQKIKAFNLALEKKAPFKSNNSAGDALIILSMFEYLEKVGSSANNVFITENYTDFSESKELRKNIHPHLKPEFERLKIRYITNLQDFLFREDSFPEMSVFIRKIKLEIETQAGASALGKIIYNPQVMNDLPGVRESYIANINYLDIVLKSELPTIEQVKFALGLIHSDEVYYQYFFKKLSAPFWFDALKIAGVFKPEHNPLPIPVNGGHQIPFWPPLEYLLKLSETIKKGENQGFIAPLFEIITSFSQHPRDNYRTWYFIIKILANIPNEHIPTSLLNYIPVWLSGEFRPILQSSELCENLFPKFMSDNPTEEDIKKAEIIIPYLFELSLPRVDILEEERDNLDFQSNVDGYSLQKTFKRKELLRRVVEYCSDDMLFFIGKQLKYLVQDSLFAKGIFINLQSEAGEIKLRVKAIDEDLCITTEDERSPILLYTFASKSKIEIKGAIFRGLKNIDVSLLTNNKNDEQFENLFSLLNNDFRTSLWNTKIYKLGNKNYQRDKISDIYTLIFRNLLDEVANQSSNRAIRLLKTFSNDVRFKLPIYKRIGLYVIGKHWEDLKPLFWEFIGSHDEQHGFFSETKYSKELFWLLKTVQDRLNGNEINILINIIDSGPINITKIGDESHLKYWKLGWYAALKEIEPFSQNYIELKNEIASKGHHYESEGGVRSGEVSPIASSQILKMDLNDIANFIHDFNPTDIWEEPNVSGLSSSLEKAVETEPQYFTESMNVFLGVPYIYIYRMLNGFEKAWKEGKSFNWNSLLNFCKSYISEGGFYKGDFSVANDGWGASSEWVVGAVANLLTTGMQSDKNAFNLKLLPLAKEILLLLNTNLKTDKKFNASQFDYPTYSLNSTAGKVLRAWLDYALRNGRNNYSSNKNVKWEEDVKNVFEQAKKAEIVDVYIMQGWYLPQFYFIDKVWVKQNIKDNYDLPDKYWQPYISGVSFCGPVYDKEMYYLLYPHYNRAIESNIELDEKAYEASLIRHFIAYYFWEFDDLGVESLLNKVIDTASAQVLNNLVSILWQQEKHIEEMGADEKTKLKNQILHLWNILNSKFENPTTTEEKNYRSSLSNLLVFAPELSDNITLLVLDSIKFINRYFGIYEILDNLNKLQLQGESLLVAKNLAKILNAINYFDHLTTTDRDIVRSLVTFLYSNGQEKSANLFCNRLFKLGHDFIRDLYNDFN